ncbi:MAG: enoyl-CoA hydratase/isomerase family protein [Hyphomicrobiales bacterium]|mgnify:CR=1 FL=1|nr:enoyl-CoA hydratase/isomerase family protein [Hyphomicrobiales bacterium]OQW82318.1 MAG: enoyl-CoA hydratase [Proteobacteria bacterium ST_bin15]
MTDKMLSRKEGKVAIMTFNNPEKHNAVSFDMWEAAEKILDDFITDPSVRVIVLTGAGGKAFVSGADISKFESERAGEEAVKSYNALVDRVYTRIYRMPKPTIAMIRGFCIGGGLNLAVCCDMRIATEKAKFALPAAKLGLGYGYNGLRRYIETIGPVATKEIFFTARQFSSEEAFRLQLVNQVVADDKLEETVMATANMIADNAPLTIATLKQASIEILKDPAEQDIALCDRMVAACFASADYREGRKAFMEKRKPEFTGS